MAKLYWAWNQDSDEWTGPRESDAECLAEARYESEAHHTEPAIWIAPVDAEKDDEAFWATFARHLLHDLDGVADALIEGGWLDPDDPGLPFSAQDRDSILANALREVLGPRPAWRSVDTSKARRVEL